jgi:hypothetical protein
MKRENLTIANDIVDKLRIAEQNLQQFQEDVKLESIGAYQIKCSEEDTQIIKHIKIKTVKAEIGRLEAQLAALD